MLKNTLHIIHLLIITLAFIPAANCQVEDKPAPPVIHMVSVQPETGFVEVIWYPSPSPNVHYYKILKVEFTGGPSYPPAYIEIGRVPASDTIFIYQEAESSLHPDGYTVESVDSVSGLSDFNQLVDSTIFLSAVFDSCSSGITLEWNDYNRWRGDINSYNLYRKLNGGTVEVIHTLSEGNNRYMVENIQANAVYGFYIEAVNNDGFRKSTSNMPEISTEMTAPPGYVNAGSASLTDNNYIELSFSIDPSSELTLYKLYRSSSTNGPFNIIDSFYQAEPEFLYTDNISYTSGIYYYKLTVINNCNQPAATSNTINNILLSGENNTLTNVLTWNAIEDWPGDTTKYQLIRKTGGSVITSDTIYEGSSFIYEDNLEDIVNYDNPVNNYFCYTVKAREYNNPNVENNVSYSNEVCITLSSDIRMPNAFVPNNDMDNKFGPVFTFIPENYKLTIYNRWGIKIWEGSEPWDGTINGEFATEGVYLYHIKVYNFNNDINEITGYVTLLYR